MNISGRRDFVGGRRDMRAQTSSEFAAVFVAIIIMGFVAITLSGQVLQSGNEGRINEAKVYWALNAQPISISDWDMALINQTTTNTTIYNLTLTLSNPTVSPITISSMNFSPRGYDDVYYTDGTYAGLSRSLSITLYPQDKLTVIVQRRNSTAPMPAAGSSYEIYVNITSGNRLTGQIQVGKTPLYGKYRAPTTGGSEYGSCGLSQIPCGSTCCDSGTQKCSAGTCVVCSSPNGVGCNTTCCLDAQVCATGLCCSPGYVNCAGVCTFGSCSCTAPTNLSCSGSCCNPSTQICNGGVCQSCSSPTSVPCLTTCCSDGWSCIAATCVTNNTAPWLTGMSFAPASPNTTSNISCNVTARDNESTSITVYYYWYKNGVNQSSLAGSATVSNNTNTTVSTLLSGNLSAGDQWACYAKAYDGTNYGALNNTPNMTILSGPNAVPNITGMSIAPASPTTSDNITCNVTARDNESSSFTVYYYWYKSGVNQTGLAGSTTVSNNTNTTVSTLYYAGNTTIGDKWACAAKAYDGVNYSSLNSTVNVTVVAAPNSAPWIHNMSIAPSSPTTTNNITCNVTALDNQSTSINVTYYWFKNGLNQTGLAGSINVTNNTNTLVSTLYYAGNLSTDDNWSCYAKPYDGTVYGALNNTENVTVGNTAPFITAMAIKPDSPTTADTLMCNVTAIDNQSTSLTIYYYWYKNGVSNLTGFVNITNGTNTNLANLSPENLSVGDNWSCYAMAYDGSAYSALNNTANVTVSGVGNTAPWITGMSIAPAAPTTSDNITCNVTARDNQSTTITIYYYWMKNGINQSGLAGSTIVSNNTNTTVSTLYFAGNTSIGDNWACAAKAYDGANYSALNSTVNVTVSAVPNTAPWIAGMSIAPASPSTSDNLTCNVTALDNQSTTITVYYYWMKNGVNQTGLAGSASVSNNTNTTVSTLYYAGNTSAGENWACAAKAYDSSLYGALNSTPNVTISSAPNTAPWITGMSIAPASPTTSDNITCNVTARDNQSTTITVYYYWMKNGINQSALAGSASVSNNTNTTVSTLYFAGNTSIGDNWACAAKAYDSSLYGALNSTVNVTVSAVPNTAPWIAGMSIAPASPGTTDNLTCNVTARDNQSTTITVYYYWMKNGVNQTGLAGSASVSNNTNTTVSTLYYAGNTSAGENWACAAKAYDSSLYGALNSTPNVTISAGANTAPTISAMIIKPDTPLDTDNLTCNVTVLDTENATTNVSYYWMKNGINQSALAGWRAIGNNTNRLLSTLYFADNTTAGDEWACAAKADDGLLSSALNSTPNVTISTANTPPIISTITLTPLTPTTSDNLVCGITPIDNESASVTIYYSWFKNGINQTALAGNAPAPNNTEFVTLIEAGNLTNGDNWYCQAMAYDGTNYSAVLASNIVTVTNPLVCGELSTPGTYTMTGNLLSPGFTCFNITSVGVTLNCAGYSITGDNTANTYGVHSNASLTIIQNCHIGKFTNAIRTVDALNPNIMICNLSSAGTVIQLTRSNAAMISSNNISSAGNYALAIFNSNAATVNLNRITGASYAAYLNFSNFTTMTGNSVTATSLYSVYVSTGNATIRNNNITGAGRAVNLVMANDSLFDGNNITSNSATASYGAVYVVSGNKNNFTSNTILETNAVANVERAVWLAGGTSSRFIANTITSTSAASTPAIHVAAAASSSTFLQNTIRGSVWVNDLRTPTLKSAYNDTSVGNAYYFLGGAGAWTVYDIHTPIPPNYATYGIAQPFNTSNVAGYFLGIGYPQDWFPWTGN